jgi:hypothetical protein
MNPRPSGLKHNALSVLVQIANKMGLKKILAENKNCGGTIASSY